MESNYLSPHSSFVSVIIPVFNEVERLRICLQALEIQTYPRHLYQTIVVDNGSERNLNIAGIVDKFQQSIYTFEDTPGSYAARNKGLSISTGSIIAFTDADCIPSSNWIEEGVKSLMLAKNCGLVGGKIEVFFKDRAKPTSVELYEYFIAFNQQEFIEKLHFSATANLFAFREIFEKVGYFNSSLKSSGDIEWCRRVYDSGYQLIYNEKACIKHPARHSFHELYLRTVRIAGGKYDLENQTQNIVFLKFIKSYLPNLIPPVKSLKQIWMDTRLNRVEQKIKFSIAFLFVHYVSAWEKLRLRCGGVSSR